MAVYEYKCEACEQVTECARKHLERHDPLDCEHCGSNDTHLIISRNSFALHGSGWYVTDYKGKGR